MVVCRLAWALLKTWRWSVKGKCGLVPNGAWLIRTFGRTVDGSILRKSVSVLGPWPKLQFVIIREPCWMG